VGCLLQAQGAASNPCKPGGLPKTHFLFTVAWNPLRITACASVTPAINCSVSPTRAVVASNGIFAIFPCVLVRETPCANPGAWVLRQILCRGGLTGPKTQIQIKKILRRTTALLPKLNRVWSWDGWIFWRIAKNWGSLMLPNAAIRKYQTIKSWLSQRDCIRSSQNIFLNYFCIGSFFVVFNHGPGSSFFLVESSKFKIPSRSSMSPEMEEDLVSGAFKITQLEHMKTHRFRRDWKTKNARTKLDNIKIRRGTANGCLKDQSNREIAEMEPAATERSNQEESTRAQGGSDRKAEPLFDDCLNSKTRAEVKAWQLHGAGVFLELGEGFSSTMKALRRGRRSIGVELGAGVQWLCHPATRFPPPPWSSKSSSSLHARTAGATTGTGGTLRCTRLVPGWWAPQPEQATVVVGGGRQGRGRPPALALRALTWDGQRAVGRAEPPLRAAERRGLRR